MFQLKDGIIYLTRGDSASLSVSLTDQSGTAYTMQTGDTLTLTVRAMPNDESEVVLHKVSTSSTITIDHDDTKDEDIGQYSADIQLTLTDGHVFTVWPVLDEKKMKTDKSSWKNFWLTPEVTL